MKKLLSLVVVIITCIILTDLIEILIIFVMGGSALLKFSIVFILFLFRRLAGTRFNRFTTTLAVVISCSLLLRFTDLVVYTKIYVAKMRADNFASEVLAYADKNQALPPSVSELQLSSQGIGDPFSASNLKYVKESQSVFLVYSVGPDGVDQTGEKAIPDWALEPRFGNLISNHLAVSFLTPTLFHGDIIRRWEVDFDPEPAS